MKSFRYKLQKWIITSPIGEVQIFKRPFWFIFGGSTSYKIKGEEQRKIINNLKVGDLVFKQWDKYISGKFIPGFWPHVGVYIGRNKVIHADVQRGVVSDDILTYLRCDSAAVLRCTKEFDKKEIVSRAKSLLGKEYDYAFDFNDDIFQCCTELVNYTYGNVEGIHFERKKDGFFSKDTIPPDNVYENEAFEVIIDIRP